MDSVLCCDMDDEPRFRDIIAGLVERKEVPRYAKFFNESQAKKNSRQKKVRCYCCAIFECNVRKIVL